MLEGIVIVGSILLAFGIDAAWDDRERNRQRDALIAAIGSDMSRARDEIDRVAEAHQRGRGAAADLLNLAVAPPVTGAEAQRIDSLVAAACCSTASYDAPLGAVESLFGAGALDMVANPELAFELTAYPALVDDLAREQELLQSMALGLVTYLGAEGVDVSLLDLEYIDPPWALGRTTAHAVVETPRFRGIVSNLWYRYSNTTGILAEMREAIARIEALLAGGEGAT